MTLSLMLIGSYLLGSISFAIIISKVMRLQDPRSYGSNNAGATNVMRSGNKKAAIFTLVGDLIKGVIVIVMARLGTRGLDGGDAIVGMCGVIAVIGHIYPVFFKFKGGKGVATAIGVMLGLNPFLALLLLVSWIVVFKLFSISSLAAIVATALAPLYAYILMGNSSYFGATTIIAFFVLYKHKQNILRLIRGTESNFKKGAGRDVTDIVQMAAADDMLLDESLPSLNAVDYFAVLSLSIGASQAEIDAAYQRLLLMPAVSKEAVEEAYAILSDPVKRNIYECEYKKHNPRHD